MDNFMSSKEKLIKLISLLADHSKDNYDEFNTLYDDLLEDLEAYEELIIGLRGALLLGKFEKPKEVTLKFATEKVLDFFNSIEQ